MEPSCARKNILEPAPKAVGQASRLSSSQEGLPLAEPFGDTVFIGSLVLAMAVAVSGCGRPDGAAAQRSTPHAPLAPAQSREEPAPQAGPKASAPAAATSQEAEPGQPPAAQASAAQIPDLAETDRSAVSPQQPGRKIGGLVAESGQQLQRAAEEVADATPEKSGETPSAPQPALGAGLTTSPSDAGSGDPRTARSPLEEAEIKRKPPVPLVDDPDSLQQLHPAYPVWIDRESKYVVIVGEVCQCNVPLELFVCLKGSKEHEAVVAVETKAYVVHAALLAVRAEPGSPVRFDPEFVPARGPEIEVTMVWEDEQGRRRRAGGQDWVQDVSEVYAMFDGLVLNEFDEELNVGDQWAAWKAMEQPWVFAGSRFVKDERTGEQYYQADLEGDLICVSNFPSAVLDVPVRSSDSNAALLFSAFAERIPPSGTPVTLILTPKLRKGDGGGRDEDRRLRITLLPAPCFPLPIPYFPLPVNRAAD